MRVVDTLLFERLTSDYLTSRSVEASKPVQGLPLKYVARQGWSLGATNLLLAPYATTRSERQRKLDRYLSGDL